jgi:phosphoribosylanthranilate isomerase
VKAKICGVCTPADAAEAAAAGAGYVGVILAPGRSRSRTLSEAAAIFERAGTAGRVGVFVDAAVGEMAEAARTLGLDVVQLHGDEAPADLVALRRALPAGVRLWKAVRVRTPHDIAAAAARYAEEAEGLLLDGWSAAGQGGVGARFDWEAAAQDRRALPAHVEVIVAGGLGPDNVAGVIRLLQPDVVDVSSGVEASLCRKSTERVRAFIAAAQAAAD